MVFDVFGRGAKPTPKSGGAPQGKPLHLLQYDEGTKKFSLGEEALDCLRAIKGPVGVLAVCGRARQGKSFILNQLAGAAASNDAGFKVGPTVRPCTKGLWIWSAPIPRQTPSGEGYHLVLLDTEGIDAYDQTGQYSTQIFSMAVLLSSLFVYNQMGGIDEAALDRLSLVTEMTKHIRVRSDEKKPGSSDPTDLARFSPSFVWLLRDFYLDFSDSDAAGGPERQISPAEYLEKALRNVSGTGPGVTNKNAIRESIRGLFPERECFPLVRPVNDEQQLRNLDALPFESFRPEFKTGVKALITALFTRCRPKSVGDDVLNGASLAGMAEKYVAAINGGAVPAIATAWQSVSESECRKAADLAERTWYSAFIEEADSGGADDVAISNAHENAYEKAVVAFDAAAVGGAGSSARKNARAIFDATILRRKREYVANRRAEASAACAKRLAAAGARVRAAADADDATVAAVVAAADAEASSIDADGAELGPERHALLVAWLRDVSRSAVGNVARRVSERLERAAASAAASAAAATSRADECEKRAADAQRLGAVCAERASVAEMAAAEANAREREMRADLESARSIAASETRFARREAEASLKETAELKTALALEKKRSGDLAERGVSVERALAEARRGGADARVSASESARKSASDLKEARDALAAAERGIERAESAARNAEALATSQISEARALAAGSVSAAEGASADAKRRAADFQRRAEGAEREVERLRAALNVCRASAEGRRVSAVAPVGDDFADADDADETFERWREEAEAAATTAVLPKSAAAVTERGPGAGGKADDPETPGSLASRRNAAESMTIAQLKHELQVMGLAHLYVGKKSIKKAQLVDMFVNGE
jgi:hypothetical protein